jgi:hypothetical protein
VPSNELLTTADDALLIPCLGLTEEVDSRGPPHPGKDAYAGANVSKVAFEKEDRNDDQTERVSARVPSEEEYGCQRRKP